MFSEISSDPGIASNTIVNPYGMGWASREAQRCLSCYDPPCQAACPASIPVPEFIRSIRSCNLIRAAKMIRDANPLANICGAICPEEQYCQSRCTRAGIDSPVRIRELHRFASQYEEAMPGVKSDPEATIAIVGSGPAGISAAIKLAETGIKSVVYERSAFPGGVPGSSIPKFRLSDNEVTKDIDYAKSLGIEIVCNTHIEESSELLGRFKAVFIAAGLATAKKLNIPGEESSHVVSALDFLNSARRGELTSLDQKRVIVIGGGNVSLDVASTAKEFGAREVHLLYRRGPGELKVWKSELKEASNRGVIIDFQVYPLEFICDAGKLMSVSCGKTFLTEELDSSGRKIPKTIPGTFMNIQADLAITAIGLTSNVLDGIKINGDLSTSTAGIFAGGDIIRGEGTVVEAVRDGKVAAETMLKYLAGQAG